MSTAVDAKQYTQKSSPIQSIGKLVALCTFAAMMSTFGPFALVAPAAMALAFIHYGPKKVVFSTLLLSVGLYFLIGQNVNAYGSIGTFIYSAFVGFVIDRFTAYKVHPVKAVLNGGVAFYIGVILIGAFVLSINGMDLNDIVFGQVKFFIEQLKQSPEYGQIISAGGRSGTRIKKLD